jgi:hypothetical protein
MIASNGNNSDSSSQSGNLNNIFTCGFETPIDNSQFTLLTSAMNPGFDAGPPKMAPYNGSNSGSSTQSEEDPDNIFISNLEAATDNGQFVFISSNTNTDYDIPAASSFQAQSNEYQGKLSIISEPRRNYRARYACEIDELQNRAKRFIRSESNNRKYEYPTVKVFICSKIIK